MWNLLASTGTEPRLIESPGPRPDTKEARNEGPTEGKDKMGKRFAIVIGVAATGVMALGAQTAASAGLVKYDTSLDNGRTERGVIYHGSVESKVRKCERGRRVVLFKKQPGVDRKVDHQRSNRDGNWGFVRRRRGGHFYAKETRERHEGKGYVCLAARAPNVTLRGEGVR